MSAKNCGPRMNDDFKIFVEKSRLKKRLEADLKQVTKEITEMQDDLIDDMAEMGIDKFTTEEGETLYIHTRTASSPKISREDACGALQLAGHGDLVNFNYNTISVNSLLNELEETGQLDEDMLAAFNIHKILSVRVRGIKI